MQIGICDDDRIWHEKAGRIVREFSAQILLDVDVICFGSGEELLEYTAAPLDILFMDIEMGKKDGIEIAASVNKIWKHCQVIYLTNYLYYATEVYHTDHVFFVLKEQFDKKCGEVMNKALHALSQQEKKLLFSLIGSKTILLAPRDILYFERDKRVTRIKTVWENYETWEKLDEIMPTLSTLDFVRCHNSYIVYLPAVREMQKGAFIMNDETKIIISRSYVKAAKEAFMSWAMLQIS